MSCNGLIYLASAGFVLHWLDMSCISWICLFIGGICLAFARSVLRWLNLSRISKICLVLSGSSMYCFHLLYYGCVNVLFWFSSEMYSSPVHLLALLFIGRLLLGLVTNKRISWLWDGSAVGVFVCVCMYVLLNSMNVGLFPKK